MENWFGTELIEKWYKNAQQEMIISNGKEIHLEVYDTGNIQAPTLVFAHGIAGYARLLLPFIIPIYEKGYNIIAPDLEGYGYNNGKRGDFEWDIHLKNLRDTVIYARRKFSGKIILGGASMGGPLAYSAATRYGNIDALACYCLFDFSDQTFIKAVSKMGKYTYALLPLLKLIVKVFGKRQIKITRLISYEGLSVPELINYIDSDPQAGVYITFSGALSLLLNSKPDLSYEMWNLPTLIVQPGSDTMTPPEFTLKIFKKLGSLNKKYVKLEGAIHFPVSKKYYTRWANEFDNFMKKALLERI